MPDKLPETNLGIGSRVEHPSYGEGVVCAQLANSFKVSFVGRGAVEFPKSFTGMRVIERVEPQRDLVSFPDVASKLRAILDQYADLVEVVPMGERWTGGKLVIQPADASQKSKEIPIQNFFHKIVMLRDRLRVMEQKINASKGLSDEEKVDLQQYITRIYGSLTTFNLLFSEKDDYFVGAKSDK